MSNLHHARVVDGVYVGSKDAVIDETLKNNQITLIINLSGIDHPNVPSVPVINIKCLHDQEVGGRRAEMSRIRSIFVFTADKIHEEVSRGGNVLVHCSAGVNRSAAAIATYLMRHRGYKYNAAVGTLRQVNSKRLLPALTNQSFLDILRKN